MLRPSNRLQHTSPEIPPPLPSPHWAASSIPEDRGIAHETTTAIPDALTHFDIHREELMTAEITLRATDRLIRGQWLRTPPTIVLDSGEYTTEAARQLCTTITALLETAERDDTVHHS